MPTTSKLKRPSGGRLLRFLASLRPPARAGGPLPVQTGFPTSLADIVVKNHSRLRNPRRRHRAAPAPAAAAAAEPAPAAEAQAQEKRELSVADQDAAAPATVTARPGRGAGGFSIRPGLLVACGAVALALLVIWSKQLVATATLASLALSWIEYARTVRDRRPETEEVLDSRRGRGFVSPIREAAAASPRPTTQATSESDNGNADDDCGDRGRDDSPSSAITPKRKQSRRSLRKLLATKLRNGMTLRDTDTGHGGDAGEHERPKTPRRHNAEPAAGAAAAPAEERATPTQPLEATTDTDDERCQRHCQRGGALPLPALVPIILAGLVAGKLPALALAVLCVAFSSSVKRVPTGQQASR